MEFSLEFGVWPQVFLLVFARMAGLINSAPFFTGEKTPVAVKTAISLAMAVILAPIAPAWWVGEVGRLSGLFELASAVFGEVTLGVATGLVCRIFLAAFQVGGDIMSYNAGLMMAQEVDPNSGIRSPLLSRIMQEIFVMAVILSGGHLLIIRMAGGAFYHAGPQIAWLNGDTLAGITGLGSAMFDWGFRLAAPVMAAVMTLNAGLGLIARLEPTFNILFLSIPLRLGAALSVFLLSLVFGQGLTGVWVDRMLDACAAFFAAQNA